VSIDVLIGLLVAGLITQAVLGCGIYLRHRDVTEKLTVATYRARLLRWALIEISKRHNDCGCSPCMGACRSVEAWEAENEGRIEIAIAAIKVDETFRSVKRPPLPICERPRAHAGVNAGHHSFMDRLTCKCEGCVKWRELTSPPERR
jgi:hypothetical protein